MAKSETGGTLSLYRKTRRPGDKALAFCIYLAAALTVCILVGIYGYILDQGRASHLLVLPVHLLFGAGRGAKPGFCP